MMKTLYGGTPAVWLAALAALLLCAPTARAKSGVQLTPDGKRTLISKDVGTERWAITLNADDSSVTGNVFQSGGGEPQFVWCEETGRGGGTVSLRCSGASRCPLDPCGPEDWGIIADVELPETFLLPPLEFPDAAPASVEAIRIERRLGADGAGAPSGVQLSPDGKRRLVSKDVGGERWAITLHEDDLSVTGNVFFPGGGEPRFVWCGTRGFAQGTFGFRCEGADPCSIAPCSRDAWTVIAEVGLPESFFSPPPLIDGTAASAAAVAALGQDEAFTAILLATDRGYSMAQILRATVSGGLRLNGLIVTQSGVLLEAEGPPTGFFAASASSATSTTPSTEKAQGGTLTAQELCQAFGDQLGDQVDKTELLIRLRDRGFTLDQIRRLSQGRLEVVDCNTSASLDAYRECIDDNGRALNLVNSEGSSEEPGEESEESTIPKEFTPCGNGVLDGEECDGIQLDGQTCATKGAKGGRLRCDEVCNFDTSLCRDESKCGDSKADTDEVCDGTDLKRVTCLDFKDEFIGGDLRCAAGCGAFDTTLCLRAATCGNGKVEVRGEQKLEDCDGSDFGGARCDDFDPFVAGRLKCHADCSYDTSECQGHSDTNCGNGTAEGEEECDRRDLHGYNCVSAGNLIGRTGRYKGGALGCSTACEFVFGDCTSDTECPDQVREGQEECDGTDFGDATCMSVGKTHHEGPFVSGPLSCTPDCFIKVEACVRGGDCGNGKKEDRFEDCDRNDFGFATCENAFGRPGRLLCTPECRFDRNSCERLQQCGDDFIEGTERCDGFNLNDQTCASLGLGGGELRCGADCQFDETRCFGAPECGNDIREGEEECDSTALNGRTCKQFGFDSGDLHCATNCTFDTSECVDGPECGDGKIEGNEDCEGTNLAGATCRDLDFEAGDLHCFTDCKFDTRACLDEAPCEEELCPDGSCIPLGGDCCGGGNWCNPGTLCADDGLCCPPGQSNVCAGMFCMPSGADCCGSLGWCAPGSVCSGTGCCPVGTPKSCGDGTCTTNDRVCCGNGISCPGGTTCLPGGQCG